MSEPLLLVTGAASGIGRAVAYAAARRGQPVVLCDRDLAGLRATESHIAASVAAPAWSYPCDAADGDAVRALVVEVERDRGPIAQLALCAGVFAQTSLLDPDASAFQACLGSNTLGVLHFIQHVAAAMVQRGRGGAVVTVASNAASTPRIGMGAYAASKAAAVALTRCAGLELASHRIRCNVVSPGSTDTPMQRALWHDERGAARVIAGDPTQFRLGIPLGRIASADDVAQAVCFLLSDAARHITMQELTVDGGATF